MTDESLKLAATGFANLSGCQAVTDSGWGQAGGGEGYAGLTTVNGIIVHDQRQFEPSSCKYKGFPGTIVGLRGRGFYCPAGTSSNFTGSYGPEKCAKPVTDRCTIPPLSNPISPATGEKLQSETDFAGGLLTLRRQYHSFTEALPLAYAGQDAKPGNNAFGTGWRSDYATFLYPVSGSTAVAAVITRANGEIQVYRPDGSAVLPVGRNDAKLEFLSSGYRLRNGSQMEVFDVAGNLLTITDTTGRTRTLSYDANGLLSSVAEETGRKLTFAYDASNRVASGTDPAGGLYQYGYDANDNLTTVTYPDNTVVQYLYDNATFVNALTGIIDENGNRFGTYTYDDQGRAYESRHAGDVDKYIFNYSGGTTTVVDPLGSSRWYAIKTILGVTKGYVDYQPSGSGSNGTTSVLTYDANGNVAIRSDFDVHRTCYAYDLMRNLETKRVEGVSLSMDCASALASPPAPTTAYPVRTINTVWHPDWRLESRRAEPKKLTTWVYNGQVDPVGGGTVSCAPSDALLPDGKPIAVLCKKTEQATTDATGASGFSATVTGTARSWTYTYNRYGQVLTANGPRSDVNDTTTYTYYADTTGDHTLGDLESVTDPLGHLTRYTRYDPNGRLLESIDANGLVTAFTYTPRGWLETRQVGSELTTYDYDAVGQLKKVTASDSNWLGYDYDAAHRLTSIYDSRGDRISYTLDNAGNRTREDVSDPSGNLVRTQSRVYDALSRLQNIIQPE